MFVEELLERERPRRSWVEGRRWKLILGRPFEMPSKEEIHEVDQDWEK